MITVNENRTGIDNTATLYKIAKLGEVYNKDEKPISCFYEYDCNNKLYYEKGNRFANSRILKQVYAM